MKWTYKKLHVCRLSREGRARTCGYWYVVTEGTMAHTAFRTRKSLEQWLTRFGLKLTRELTAGDGGCYIEGTYSRAYEDANRTALDARKGLRIRLVDNGEYTTGVIQEDETGHRTVYLLGPNTDREIHPYAESLTIEYADWDDNEERACA